MFSKFFPLEFPLEEKCAFALSPSQTKLCTTLCNLTMSLGLEETRLGQATEESRAELPWTDHTSPNTAGLQQNRSAWDSAGPGSSQGPELDPIKQLSHNISFSLNGFDQ